MKTLPPDSDIDQDIPLEEDLALDTGDADTFYKEEMRDLQQNAELQKLSHRTTLLFILIPCLLAAVFGFAYMDVRNRLNRMQSASTEEVRRLSADLQKRVATLSEDFKKLETSMGERLSILKDASVAMQERVKANQRRIKALGVASVDKKVFEKAAADRSKELAELKAKLAEQQSSVQGLSQKLLKEIDEEANVITAMQSDLREQAERLAANSAAIEVVQQKVLKLELRTKALSEQTIDKADWEALKENEHKKMAALEARIKDLDNEVSWLEKKLKLTRERPAKASEKSPQTPVQKETSVSKSGTAGAPDRIIEQEIKD
ncbi:MAG: hypothetical protein JRI36_12930 [Deltaproteobacteria bacterium]|nr:hypothetical protein [Deltaproteobacteria bacterium]